MEFERFKLRLPSLFILDKENEMKERLNYVYVGINIHKETHTAVLMTFLEEVTTIGQDLRNYLRLWKKRREISSQSTD